MRFLSLLATLAVSVFAVPAPGQVPATNRIELASISAAPGSIARAKIYIDNQDELAGFQIALNFDTQLVQIFDTELTGLSEGAELFITSDTVLPGEYAWAVLVDFLPPFSRPPIPTGIHQELGTVVWQVAPEIAEGTIIPTEIVSGAGNPVIETIFALDNGFSLYPELVSGQIEITTLQTFVRGDCDSDDVVELEDAIWLLNYMFSAGTPPVCNDSCDANDDAMLDIADPLYMLGNLFSGGADPPAPFGVCGSDPTVMDPYECVDFPPCP